MVVVRLEPVVEGVVELLEGELLVEEESHLLELVRCVHLNPVRARVCEHPDANDWSSHCFYAGSKRSPDWLDTDTVLSQFDAKTTEARRRYRVFIESRSARRPALARRILARVWAREYKGKQAGLAPYLDVRSSVVSRWHTRAVAEARSHGDIYERVVSALPSIEVKTRLDTGELQRKVRNETRTTVKVELDLDAIPLPRSPFRLLCHHAIVGRFKDRNNAGGHMKKLARCRS